MNTKVRVSPDPILRTDSLTAGSARRGQLRTTKPEKELSASVRTRARLGLSQARFAALLGVSTRTVQDWEQGRREPAGAARTLLRVAAEYPQVLQKLAS